MFCTLAILAAFGLQSLQPAPPFVTPGERVRVVLRDASGTPIQGVAVVALGPDAQARPIGSTDGDGAVGFDPDLAGDWRLSAHEGQLELVAPLAVVPRPPREWLGVFGAAAAAGLCAALSRRARDRRAA